MSCVCLGACVTGSVRRLVENWSRDGGKKQTKKKLNILTRKPIFAERNDDVGGEFQESKFLPLKEADPYFPEEEEVVEEEKKNEL